MSELQARVMRDATLAAGRGEITSQELREWIEQAYEEGHEYGLYWRWKGQLATSGEAYTHAEGA